MSYRVSPPPPLPHREALPLQVPRAKVNIEVRSSPEVYADLHFDWGLMSKTWHFHVVGSGKDAALVQTRDPSVYHGTASFERLKQVQNAVPTNHGVDPGYGSGWGGESMERSYGTYGGARGETAWEREPQAPTRGYCGGGYVEGIAAGAVPGYADEPQWEQPYQSRGTHHHAPDAEGSRREGRVGNDRVDKRSDGKQKHDRWRPHAGEKKRK